MRARRTCCGNRIVMMMVMVIIQGERGEAGNSVIEQRIKGVWIELVYVEVMRRKVRVRQTCCSHRRTG